MADDISKLCSDFLREAYPGLKASHARELVAAFFGYKSHAALLHEVSFSPNAIANADVLVPAIDMIDRRQTCLSELSNSVPSGADLAGDLVEFLEDHRFFTGSVWSDCVDLGSYIQNEYLPDNLTAGDLDNELADTIAETNAFFDEPIYDNVDVDEKPDSIIFTVNGEYNGEHDSEGGKLFCGDSIEFQFVYEMRRVAGRIGFSDPVIIDQRSSVKDYSDYSDEEDLVVYGAKSKGLEKRFAEEFDKVANQRGFRRLPNKPPFANHLYSNDDWVIGSLIVTMFPDTTVTIRISPQNPPDGSSKHRRRYDATWSHNEQKWMMSSHNYTNNELISYAFDQMQNPKVAVV